MRTSGLTRVEVAIVVAMIAVMVAAWVFVRAPIRNASKIAPGDSPEMVHKLLGNPDLVFNTTDELRASDLGPMDYVFTDRSGRSGISVDQLPPVDSRAEWFGYASAGHLVYYDDDGVVAVFWGGT
jgi:hypothetical protein